MSKLLEADDYSILIVLVIFLLINFSAQIGQIYYAIAGFGFFLYYFIMDKNYFRLIPVEHEKKKRLINLVWALGAYVAFISISGYITIKAFSFTDISALIASTFSATPILYGSDYLKLVVWGVIIAIIETKFFFRTLPQWILHLWRLKFPTNAFSWAGISVSVFFGFMFALFHAVAKGITNNSALLVTFFFGFISMMLVIHFKESIQAIFLHIVTNTIATMQQLGIGFFSADASGINSAGLFILGSILLLSWFLMFQEIPFGQRLTFKIRG